jgi:hypothetical protein
MLLASPPLRHSSHHLRSLQAGVLAQRSIALLRTPLRRLSTNGKLSHPGSSSGSSRGAAATVGEQVGYFGAGVAASFCGSMVGLGGGFVLIPLLTRFGRFSQHLAHGSSLAVVSTTGLVGMITYGTASEIGFRPVPSHPDPNPKLGSQFDCLSISSA